LDVTNTNNDAPVPINGNFSVGEDASSIIGNVKDADGEVPTLNIVTAPQHGTVTLDAQGNIIYTPDADYIGTDTFSYTLTDATGGVTTSDATITLNVTNTNNDAPVATADSYTLNEDHTLNVTAPGVLGNDTDIDGNPLTATLVSGVAHGTLTFNADGSFTYVPNANYNGSDSFTYKVNDGTADGNSVTVSLTVNAVNDAPTNISLSNSHIAENSAAGTVIGNLSGTDSDTGDTLTYTLPAGLTDNAHFQIVNGQLQVKDALNFETKNSYTVTIKVTDQNGLSFNKTFTINVDNVNEAPTNISLSNNHIAENSAVGTVIGNLSGTDPDSGNTLTYTLPAGLTDNNNFQIVNGQLQVKDALNFESKNSYTVTIKVTDQNGLSFNKTFIINVSNVNEAPTNIVLSNDHVAENSAVGTVIGNLSGTDPDTGNTLTFKLPNNLGDNNHFQIVNGQLQVKDPLNFEVKNNYSVTVRVTDSGGLSYDRSFTIKVDNLNEAPVASNDNYQVKENSTLIVPSKGVLLNDSDVDSANIAANIVSGPKHGTLSFNANGSFIYKPNANYFGMDSFTYTANDGSLASNVAKATIIVTDVANNPVAKNDNFKVKEDGTLKGNVLKNDTIEGNGKAFLVKGAAHGKITFNKDGTFTYKPDANYNGKDSFTYQTRQGGLDSNIAKVSLEVTSVNDIPKANNAQIKTSQNNSVSGSVHFSDRDNSDGVRGNNQKLTASIASGPKHGTIAFRADGTFTYKPAEDYHGLDSFTYTVKDGIAKSHLATVSIIVTPDVPVAQSENYSIECGSYLEVEAEEGVLANDTNSAGDTKSNLVAKLVNGPDNASAFKLNADGSFSYCAKDGYRGSDEFSYQVVDKDTGLVSKTVTDKIQVSSNRFSSGRFSSDQASSNEIFSDQPASNQTLSDQTSNRVLSNQQASMASDNGYLPVVINPDLRLSNFTNVPSFANSQFSARIADNTNVNNVISIYQDADVQLSNDNHVIISNNQRDIDIGTYTVGMDQSVNVLLNENATEDMLTTLARHVSFYDASPKSIEASHTVQFEIQDPQGKTTSLATEVIYVEPSEHAEKTSRSIPPLAIIDDAAYPLIWPWNPLLWMAVQPAAKKVFSKPVIIIPSSIIRLSNATKSTHFGRGIMINRLSDHALKTYNLILHVNKGLLNVDDSIHNNHSFQILNRDSHTIEIAGRLADLNLIFEDNKLIYQLPEEVKGSHSDNLSITIEEPDPSEETSDIVMSLGSTFPSLSKIWSNMIHATNQLLGRTETSDKHNRTLVSQTLRMLF
jgi:VCBS repeat-containing protein